MIQAMDMSFNVRMEPLANREENAERVRIMGEFRVPCIPTKYRRATDICRLSFA